MSTHFAKLSGKKGILHLENVNDNSKTITFEQDLGEDGVIEDVDMRPAVTRMQWLTGMEGMTWRVTIR